MIRAGLFVFFSSCFVCLFDDLRQMKNLGYGYSKSYIDTQLKGWSSNSNMVSRRPVVELGIKDI